METTGHQAFLCSSSEHLSESVRGKGTNHNNTMKALITRKVGMTSTIAEDGTTTAITLLSASPCVITQVKTAETDGYTAVQLGFEEAKSQNITKAQAGHFKPAKMLPKIIREFRLDEITEYLKVGETISPEVFSVGDVVDATGTSKGKGWAGTIRRHNFHRQRKTHGGKGNTRKVGSIGSMYPQHIFKGKKMAGQLGDVQVTIKNLRVALVDVDKQVIGLVGAVPGPRKGIVLVREAVNHG
jgi:large subunit ribosomal protein L3